MMEVAYVTIEFPRPSETFVTREVRALKELGVDISVYTLRPPHADAEQMTKERGIGDIPVYDRVFESIPFFLRWGVANPGRLVGFVSWIVQKTLQDPVDLFKSLLLVPRAVAIFQKICDQRPDLVHLYWGHYPSIVGWLLKTYEPQLPITTFIGAYDLKKQYGGTEEVLSASKRVFTMAKINEEPLKEWFGVSPGKVKVVYQSIDLEEIQKSTEEVSEEPRRVASAGRLVRSKRMDDVLRVFASVHETFASSRLVIMGDGPDRRRLEQLSIELGVEEEVEFPGHVNERRVFEEMARADVFLFMSDKAGERLPNVVKEAMACGCFCVSSQTPGMEELIDNGEDGYLVAPGDLEAATEIVSSYFEDRKDYEEVKDKAETKIERLFNLGEAVRGYRDEWETIASE
jgi:glycosyltransferase involved in cell wall biosynthesis